jgi:GST-like protein
MIDLHYWTTPNGHKITMFLEETGVEYVLKPVNLQMDEQLARGRGAHRWLRHRA